MTQGCRDWSRLPAMNPLQALARAQARVTQQTEDLQTSRWARDVELARAHRAGAAVWQLQSVTGLSRTGVVRILKAHNAWRHQP